MLTSPSPKIGLTDLTPRYYQLYLSVRDRIQSGELLPKCMIPTERELCEEYSVSRITVIKAMDILETEGFIERQQGRGTFVKEHPENDSNGVITAPTVAFVCGFISHPFQASILVGIAGVLAKYGICMQVFGSVDSSKSEAQSIERALDREVNGLIVYPWADYQNDALFRGLLAKGIPTAMVDRYYPDLNVDYAVFDGWQGGFELTTRLIQRGHEKIAFAISDEILPTSVHDRLSGYEAALEKGGVPYDENLVWLDVTLPTQTLKDHKTQHDLETKLCDQLLTEQPTGLVAVNYDVAEFLLNNLHALSLKADMPDYLLKTIEIGSFCHKPRPVNAPYVSVLAMQPGEILGVTAAEILVGRLSHKLQSTPQQIKLPMEIVEMRPIKS